MAAYNPLVIHLQTRSAHPDDQRAGWHTWRVEFHCVRCDSDVSCAISGTKDDAQRYYADRVCDLCAEESPKPSSDHSDPISRDWEPRDP